jgi:hypothetical protein
MDIESLMDFFGKRREKEVGLSLTLWLKYSLYP